ncbi:hypothetical protein [Bacillus mojavensis]
MSYIIQERFNHASYRATSNRCGQATKKSADEIAYILNNYDPKNRYDQWISNLKNQVRQQFQTPREFDNQTLLNECKNPLLRKGLSYDSD